MLTDERLVHQSARDHRGLALREPGYSNAWMTKASRRTRTLVGSVPRHVSRQAVSGRRDESRIRLQLSNLLRASRAAACVWHPAAAAASACCSLIHAYGKRGPERGGLAAKRESKLSRKVDGGSSSAILAADRQIVPAAEEQNQRPSPPTAQDTVSLAQSQRYECVACCLGQRNKTAAGRRRRSLDRQRQFSPAAPSTRSPFLMD